MSIQLSTSGYARPRQSVNDIDPISRIFELIHMNHAPEFFRICCESVRISHYKAKERQSDVHQSSIRRALFGSIRSATAFLDLTPAFFYFPLATIFQPMRLQNSLFSQKQGVAVNFSPLRSTFITTIPLVHPLPLLAAAPEHGNQTNESRATGGPWRHLGSCRNCGRGHCCRRSNRS